MGILSFDEMEMSKEIRTAIKKMGFEAPTEIQAKTIPVIGEGHDIIGKSQTGTGKTVAFGIPALEVLDPELKALQILILCPTRELAMQACDEMGKLSIFKNGVKIVDIYGGVPMDKQIAKLRTANIVIGTPGRIMDHMRRKTLKLSNIKMVILDEADEMLSMGFREDIEEILEKTPEERQTILFSATMPKEILDLTRKFQKSPKLIEVDNKQMTVKNIDQFYYNVPMGRKMDALNLILSYKAPQRAILFCNTKRMVDDITEYLRKCNFTAEGLHGDMKQLQRIKVMSAFKKGNINILIATDVAARGIDVNDIDYVINYDIPQNTEYYVHRIGRTGRAGKSGVALTVCSGSKQVSVLQRIAKITKSQILFEEVPSFESINNKHNELILDKIEKMVKESIDLEYSDTIDTLLKRGCDPIKVAAAVLQIHLGNKKCKIKDVVCIKAVKTDKSNDSYKKIKISIGRKDRVAPNHIVGAITESTSLSGGDIGKIEIYDDETIVSIPSNRIDEILIAMKNCKICGIPVTSSENKNKNNYNNFKKDYRRLNKTSKHKRF